ncbi:MAG: Cys-tRNA(Pro) deacylase [Desulfobacterales bacterium]|nr:Cys-tRNA(Pro) deacylase [Desulfobacterales bacterium]
MTPATKALKRAKIEFDLLSFDHDSNETHFGKEAAAKLGLPEDHLFKTLVVSVDGQLTVAVVPVSRQLNLKALAKAVKAKKAKMADKSLVQKTTGYITGGVSPFGQKKKLPTVVDASAIQLDRVVVSAGRRGLQLCLAPRDLVDQTRAVVAEISG